MGIETDFSLKLVPCIPITEGFIDQFKSII
jgi:hypothetical protein